MRLLLRIHAAAAVQEHAQQWEVGRPLQFDRRVAPRLDQRVSLERGHGEQAKAFNVPKAGKIRRYDNKLNIAIVASSPPSIGTGQDNLVNVDIMRQVSDEVFHRPFYGGWYNPYYFGWGFQRYPPYYFPVYDRTGSARLDLTVG